MDLLIDIGNTRIKWAMFEAGSLYDGDAMEHGTQDAAIHSMLDKVATAPAGVVAANVAGDRFAERLAGAVRDRWSLPVRFAATQPRAGTVQNGYDDFRQLGVDRWLAMIAAVELCAGAVCIVDAGTAITIDAVAAGGIHLGGYIIPGLDLMRRSLGAETGDLRRLGGDETQRLAAGPPVPGRTTADAIDGGALASVSGLIDGCIASLRRRESETEPGPLLVVTGGDAEPLIQHLDMAARHRPQLVLEGLAMYAFDEADKN